MVLKKQSKNEEQPIVQQLEQLKLASEEQGLEAGKQEKCNATRIWSHSRSVRRKAESAEDG